MFAAVDKPTPLSRNLAVALPLHAAEPKALPWLRPCQATPSRLALSRHCETGTPGPHVRELDQAAKCSPLLPALTLSMPCTLVSLPLPRSEVLWPRLIVAYLNITPPLLHVAAVNPRVVAVLTAGNLSAEQHKREINATHEGKLPSTPSTQI